MGVPAHHTTRGKAATAIRRITACPVPPAARYGRRSPWESRILVSGVVSLGALLLLRFLVSASSTPPVYANVSARASRLMAEATAAVKRRHPWTGTDTEIDPNGTGLIGPAYTPLVTTLGQLESKRSSTDPDVAGLIVHLLYKAGVSAGDTVAIGSSGSFPAFLAASLAAAKAMDVHPVTILSLGASAYGATDPEFDLLDVYRVLQASGLCDQPPAAASLGGEKDVGSDLEPEMRQQLQRKIRTLGIPLIEEPDLASNVARRLQIYREHATGRIAAFINCGGSYADLGTSLLALKLKPGLNRVVELPEAQARGVLFAMAARNIPVIHLLYVKGLTRKFGLPWDPVPLPPPAIRVDFEGQRFGGRSFWVLCACYFLACLLIIVYPVSCKFKERPPILSGKHPGI